LGHEDRHGLSHGSGDEQETNDVKGA
jgi:hypothetical protein